MEINIDVLKVLVKLIEIADKHRVGAVLIIVLIAVYFTLKR